MAEQWDVAVVGAGPAGATSAALLARLGHSVIMLDRAHFPRPKACAEYMSPGVAVVLERLGLQNILGPTSPRTVPGMDIMSPRGAVLRVKYEHDGETFHASTLRRHILDATLVRHAVQQGVQVVEGYVAKEVVQEGSAVCGVRGSQAGAERTILARLTVIADGARSALTRSLGLSVVPRWPFRMGLVAHYEGHGNFPDGFGSMLVGSGGYCGLAPLPNEQVNVAVVTRLDLVRNSGLSATQYFEQWIRSDPRLKTALSAARRATPVRGVGPVGARSSQVWLPGALLVGDAAGFFDPFTGEGIYRALRGAELVAEVGHRALCMPDRSVELLREYPALRSRAFRRKQIVTGLVQLFVQYPWLMDYALPRLAARPTPASSLSMVLGDLTDAREFLTPRMLWSALRP